MDATSSLENSASNPLPRSGLGSVGFQGLLWTQFFTALNDNIFRWLVIGIGKDHAEQAGYPASMVLMAGTVGFVAPYLLLAAPAGFFADRFPKRSVILACKVAEIFIMMLGIGVFMLGGLPPLWALGLLMAAVALMGAQSALFSPARAGCIPEVLAPEYLSKANGFFGLATVSATVLGTGIGSMLADLTQPKGMTNVWYSALVLIGVAIIGTATAVVIPRITAGNAKRTFPWDAPVQTWRDLQTLWSYGALLRVALGIAFFYGIGALAQLNIDQLATEGGGLTESAKTPLLLALIFGVCVGMVLAGMLSGDNVELGLLPLGSFGIAATSMLLFTVPQTIFVPGTPWTVGATWACILLFVLGSCSGLFCVPLEAFMQHRSPRESRGSILAAGNFLTFSTILAASVLYMLLRLPLFDGQLQAMPTVEELTPAEIRQVDEVMQHFNSMRNEGSNRAQLTGFLDQITSPQAKDYAFRRLLWSELQTREAAGESFTKNEYAQSFPGREAQIQAVFQAMHPPLCAAQTVFLICGLLTIPVLIYILWLIPQSTVRFFFWLLQTCLYRVKVFGRENLPKEGGALLVANHISWLDGFMICLASSRPIRLVAWSGNLKSGWLKWIADKFGVIPIDPTRPKAIVSSLRVAREALQNGDLVCIFPEGGITRTGQVQGFRPGLLRILDGANVPVVPIYLDELWGSIFSFAGGKFFWKRPKRWPYPVSVFFGKPLHTTDLHAIRQAVVDLGAQAVTQRSNRVEILSRSFIRSCKRQGNRSKVADSMGSNLSGRDLLLRTLVLRRLLRRHTLQPSEQFVGLLLPPTVPGFVANMALTLDKRIAVNLNYTVSSDVLNQCIEMAGIKHVITSRKFMDKMNFKLNAEVVYLEDFKDKPTLSDKIVAALHTYVLPASLVETTLGLGSVKPDDVLTIIFTSGSTGTPKGVMLTYANVVSNVSAIEQVVQLRSTDTLIGILPFFHSFGYTVTMWTVATLNVKGAYHFSPLDARQVGKLCKEHNGTIFLATPTFLRTYLRRCEKEDLESLDVVVAGAEKLPADLIASFDEKFGVRPVEGYGTTELSPLVSVNVPPSRSIDNFQVDRKEGSVGRTVPGVAAKIVNLDTGEPCTAGQAGMLWISGPNVMKGYLNQPEKTAEVLHDGWYQTGDVAYIDDDGFIFITGRESRFSKIGGEMVPHIRIEEEVNRILAIAGSEGDGMFAAVTALPDEKRGERLVVLHTKTELSPSEINKQLSEAGLPNLFLPGNDSYVEVEQLPLLGTGKLDLHGIKTLAKERLGAVD